MIYEAKYSCISYFQKMYLKFMMRHNTIYYRGKITKEHEIVCLVTKLNLRSLTTRHCNLVTKRKRENVTFLHRI